MVGAFVGPWFGQSHEVHRVNQPPSGIRRFSDVPAERMKMRKVHRVFQSRQAVDILRQLQGLTSHRVHLFPTISRGSVRMAM